MSVRFLISLPRRSPGGLSSIVKRGGGRVNPDRRIGKSQGIFRNLWISRRGRAIIKIHTLKQDRLLPAARRERIAGSLRLPAGR
jgi:hypothetical protein